MVISTCSATSERSSSISGHATTTETSTDSVILNIKNDQETVDVTDGVSVTRDENDGESDKRKRTIDRSLGYGYNDAAGSTRQSGYLAQSKYGTYFPQLAQYTSFQHDSRPQQAEVGHRPASSFGSAAGSPEPGQLAKSPAYRGSHVVTSNAERVLPISRSPQPAPLFTASAAHAPAFFIGHSQASPNNPFPAFTSHNAPNTFLPAENFHGGPLLYQHTGSNGLAFLHNPSGYFGPQIIPVIILRIASDASGNNAFHHQGAVSPSLIQTGIHGLNLHTLLYPVQQFHTPQQAVLLRYYATQTEKPSQPLYQGGYPGGETPNGNYVQPHANTATQISQQKIYVQQNAPIIPTQSPDSAQKLRKTDTVSETGQQNEYKYGYKAKV